MKIKYWPVEMQEEIKRIYFHVEAEGTVHRRKERKGVLYDAGACGSLVNNIFLTNVKIGDVSYCITLPRLAYFLITGKQHRMIKMKNGHLTDLRFDNMVPIGPELEEDIDAQQSAIRAQMKKGLAERSLWRVNVDIEKREREKEEFNQLKARAKAERLAGSAATKVNAEPAPQPILETHLESVRWRDRWFKEHEYAKLFNEKAKSKLKEVESSRYLNGIYTGITWDEVLAWISVMQKEKDYSPEDFVLVDCKDYDLEDMKEMAKEGRIKKYEYDGYYVGLAIKNYNADATWSRGWVRDYKWLDADWSQFSEVEEYAKLKQTAFEPLAEYYAQQGVSGHQEMLEKLEKDCDEAETLFNTNKVKEEKEKADQLAKQAPLTNAEEPLEPGLEETA